MLLDAPDRGVEAGDRLAVALHVGADFANVAALLFQGDLKLVDVLAAGQTGDGALQRADALFVPVEAAVHGAGLGGLCTAAAQQSQPPERNDGAAEQGEDGDQAGVTASPANLRLAPGESGSYSLYLDSRPQGRVAVTATASPGWTLRPSGQPGGQSTATVYFTADNWNQPRSIGVYSLRSSSGTGSVEHKIGATADPDYRVLEDLDTVLLLRPQP